MFPAQSGESEHFELCFKSDLERRKTNIYDTGAIHSANRGYKRSQTYGNDQNDGGVDHDDYYTGYHHKNAMSLTLLEALNLLLVGLEDETDLSHTAKNRARGRLRDAVRYGKIKKPGTCEECGEKTEARFLHGHHHNGYGNALDVRWLCIHCHNKVDAFLRVRHGEQNSNAALTNREAEQIRLESALGALGKDLAVKFGVCEATISFVINRKNYRQVSGGTESRRAGSTQPLLASASVDQTSVTDDLARESQGSGVSVPPAQNNLSRTREGGIPEATRGNAVHADCFAATPGNNTADVRIVPAQDTFLNLSAPALAESKARTPVQSRELSHYVDKARESANGVEPSRLRIASESDSRGAQFTLSASDHNPTPQNATAGDAGIFLENETPLALEI